MRVLMHLRPDWRELPGGDVTQARRWAFWLRELGVEVQTSDAAIPDLTGIDLVHLHNLSRSYLLWPTLAAARRAGIPVVLTPLYWPVEEYERFGRPGFTGILSQWLPNAWRDRLKSAARWWRNPEHRAALTNEFWHGSCRLVIDFLSQIDALATNSHAEIDALQRLCPDLPVRTVVPSGVDAFYWSTDRDLWSREQESPLPDAAFAESNLPRRGILCVARFDPQKAQHRLIEALRPFNVQLTLVGSDNPNYPHYRSYCQGLAHQRVTILPRQPIEALKRLYQSCSVFALCSWYEISALSGLEAGCCGARVVMTARGGWSEYGGDLAWYANPASLESIRQAVEKALTAPRTPDLLGRVRQAYTWQRGAESLRAWYAEVLAHRTSRGMAA
jgi:glycosyltransferase involved in cell wall biosynthesis